jgi:hypothetical protein
MKSLFERATAEPGESANIAARNIRIQDYCAYDSNGMPDHRLACSLLARYLINDMSNSNELNDRHIANDRAYSRTDRQNAQTRIAQRTQLSAEIARLDFDDFRSLVDSLAGTPATQAA